MLVNTSSILIFYDTQINEKLYWNVYKNLNQPKKMNFTYKLIKPSAKLWSHKPDYFIKNKEEL